MELGKCLDCYKDLTELTCGSVQIKDTVSQTLCFFLRNILGNGPVFLSPINKSCWIQPNIVFETEMNNLVCRHCHLLLSTVSVIDSLYCSIPLQSSVANECIRTKVNTYIFPRQPCLIFSICCTIVVNFLQHADF